MKKTMIVAAALLAASPALAATSDPIPLRPTSHQAFMQSFHIALAKAITSGVAARPHCQQAFGSPPEKICDVNWNDQNDDTGVSIDVSVFSLPSGHVAYEICAGPTSSVEQWCQEDGGEYRHDSMTPSPHTVETFYRDWSEYPRT
jgi:hypothetical protein